VRQRFEVFAMTHFVTRCSIFLTRNLNGVPTFDNQLRTITITYLQSLLNTRIEIDPTPRDE